MKCLLLWKLCSIGNHTYMVRSLLCIRTIAPWCTSSHSRIFHLANYTGLKILLTFFPSVVFGTPRDILTSFGIQYLDSLIFWPPLLRTLLCLTSLIRFSSSRSTIISLGGTSIMFAVSMLTKMCWWMTLVTSWCTKENLTYREGLSTPYYKNITMNMVILARHKYKRWSQSNYAGHGWLRTYESTARTTIHISISNLTLER